MSENAIKILLAANSEIIRPRLRFLVSEIQHVRIVREVASEKEIVPAAKAAKPDIVVVSFPRLGRSTMRFASELHAVNPHVVIIALTAIFNRTDVETWLDAGAAYVFDPTLQLQEFIDCLERLTRERVVHDHLL